MLKILPDFKQLRPAWLLAVLIGLLIGLLIIGNFSVEAENLILLEKVNEKLREQNRILKDELIDVLRDSRERMKYILDIAMEFKFDPKVVLVVDYYSRIRIDSSNPKWKLIETPEDMTHWMLSLITVESVGDTYAVSSSGALGLTQLLLSTAQMYSPEVTRNDLFDPEINVDIAFQHLSYLLNKYSGNLLVAFDAWNRGEGRVDRLRRAGQGTGNGFARKVYSVAALMKTEM